MRRPVVLLLLLGGASALLRRRTAQQAEADLWTEATAPMEPSVTGSEASGVVRDLR